MAEQPTLKDLQAEIAALKQRLTHHEELRAVHEVLNRYTHAVDRHDREMFLSVFHADAIADHGIFCGNSVAVFDFLEKRYHESYRAHVHFIGNHICDLDGDTAHAETYAITYVVTKDGTKVFLGSARYIDRLEKRNGEWKIALRRIVSDARGEIPVAGEAAPEGKWDKTDLSYMRPLTLPADRRAAAQIK